MNTPWSSRKDSSFLPTSHCTGERPKVDLPEDPEALQAKSAFFKKLQTVPKAQLPEGAMARVECLIAGMIDGDVRLLEESVQKYNSCPGNLVDDIAVLAFVFKDTGISLLETEVFNVETEADGFYSAAVLKIWLRHARRVIFIPTDSRLESCVFSVMVHPDGRNFLKGLPSEEPRLVARQVGRVLRHALPFGPPPMSGFS